MATEFGYLLNAMERAACESNPANHNYHDKRIAVLGHVSAIEAERDSLRAELTEARKPDCRLCMNIMGCQVTAPDAITCRDGSEYFAAAPLRMYEKEGKV